MNFDVDDRKVLHEVLRAEFLSAAEVANKYFDNLEKSRVDRPESCDLTYKVKVRQTGNIWCFKLVVVNLDIGQNQGVCAYLKYHTKDGWGFIMALQTKSLYNNAYYNDVTFIDYIPHCVERYRQRRLSAKGINLPIDERIAYMVNDLTYTHLAMVEGVAHCYTYDGAFLGNRLSYDWEVYNTYISEADMYRNQLDVMKRAKEEISMMKQMYKADGYYDCHIKTNLNAEAKEDVRNMVKKSGMYHESAFKKNEDYNQKMQNYYEKLLQS